MGWGSFGGGVIMPYQSPLLPASAACRLRGVVGVVIPTSAKEAVIPAYAGIQESAWIPDHCPE
jgi:hypothetical protein